MVGVNVRIARAQDDGLSEGGARSSNAPGLLQAQAQQVLHGAVARIQGERGAIGPLGPGQIAGLVHLQAAHGDVAGEAGRAIGRGRLPTESARCRLPMFAPPSRLWPWPCRAEGRAELRRTRCRERLVRGLPGARLTTPSGEGLSARCA